MDVTLDDAQTRLAELVRMVEGGESVTITLDGQAVAQINPPPVPVERVRRPIQWDSMKDKVILHPGWDDPIDLDRFLAGDL
jgi:antitoxin (DNA-binding transcriptional repressor) of toxin-antitoxin stability system